MAPEEAAALATAEATRTFEVRWPGGQSTHEAPWFAFELIAGGKAELVDQAPETARAVLEAGEAHREKNRRDILGDNDVVPGHYAERRQPGRFQR